MFVCYDPSLTGMGIRRKRAIEFMLIMILNQTGDIESKRRCLYLGQ